ncbi:GNAT family N-acetyltransferase [Mycobacterium sp. LTG2003]
MRNSPVDVVGYTVKLTDVVIPHIATNEISRRCGVGRQMLQAVREATPRHCHLIAETGSDAVGFYIANGFVADALGEKYADAERFFVHTLPNTRLQPKSRDRI